MEQLRPDGPKDFICPFHRKSMAKVCKTCPMWQHIRGRNPNTGEEFDKWDCALALMPVLTIENSMQQRQTGAAVESFRNEMVRLNRVGLLAPETPSPPKMINGREGQSE